MVTDSSWLVTLSVLFPSLSVFSIFIYLSSVPGRGVWRGRRSVAECGMAWERQSDPGLRWQLCYDFSARSWWMVGRMLPVSPSFCIDQSVCFSSVFVFFISFSCSRLHCFGSNVPLLQNVAFYSTYCARCMLLHLRRDCAQSLVICALKANRKSCECKARQWSTFSS